MDPNFGYKPNTLPKCQRVTTSIYYPSAINETPCSHEELFKFEKQERKMYKKRSLSVRDTALIKKNRANT